MKDDLFLSAICPVYGGVAWLEEAIDCFLKQDYTGDRELIIVNSFPDQKLKIEADDVRVVNLPVRPQNLGQLRNCAVSLAMGDAIVVWDSDDVFLPHHLSLFAESYGTDDAWVWLNSHSLPWELYCGG